MHEQALFNAFPFFDPISVSVHKLLDESTRITAGNVLKPLLELPNHTSEPKTKSTKAM